MEDVVDLEDSKEVQLKSQIIGHNIILFFLLAYLLSWSFWIPIFYFVNRYGDDITDHVPIIIILILLIGLYVGLYAPAISAFIVMKLTGGNEEIRQYLKRLIKWRVGIRNFTIMLLLSLGFFFSGNLIYFLLGASLPNPLKMSFGSILVSFVDLLLLHGGQEELGWRGYALPKLQQKYSAFVSTLIVGALWAIWHLPIFYLEDSQYEGTKFIIFAMGAMMLSFFLTIIYNRTKSILMCMLFHAFVNLSFQIFPPERSIEAFSYSEFMEYLAAIILVIILTIKLIFPDFISNLLNPS
jgi:membrane protease YdiL (CAAX protease family)